MYEVGAVSLENKIRNKINDLKRTTYGRKEISNYLLD
ncbi:hypothetical protein HNQ88_004576 [Aureibacter tunicatorum]|uniref:Uncharacterized protein n=1 Tax=Aureibacter tunicatorum TaxID=866807 RepID=A0AAE3XTP7_9BACT|nr:hypothetical protein [Aureibacter tunicatorum]BDD06668.1 hypothetical protein AUTU_41510 [Aureibacter tunicatorum]